MGFPIISDKSLTIAKEFGASEKTFTFTIIFCQQLVDDCGDSGEAGKRDDDEGHLLAEQGEESLLQRSLPKVEPTQAAISCNQL